MRAVKMKHIWGVFSMKEYSQLKIFPMDGEAGIPVMHTANASPL
jgi:hypothetical protein